MPAGAAVIYTPFDSMKTRNLWRIADGVLGDDLGWRAGCRDRRAVKCEAFRRKRELSFDGIASAERGNVADAEDASTFMKDGRTDAARSQSVGGVLGNLTGGRHGVTVRAFGEMVDWLWKNDATEAAIRLEVLWNELANTRAFSLLCGYSMGNFYKHGAYENICSQHTHVVSGAGQPTPIGMA